MNDWPLVSVLIPTFNGASFVGQTIESALAQNYPCMEILVGDDASTDGTPGLLAGFGPRIRVIASAKNQGNGALRNQLVAEARGKYIAFLDHDDLWLPGKIGAQVQALEHSPTAVLCHTATELFGDDSGHGPVAAELQERIAGSCFEEQFRRNGVVISSAMVRASALPRPAFWTDLGGVRDFGLWLRMLFLGDAIYIAKVMTQYRKHRPQITQEVGGARRLQILAGAARLRVLDEFASRMEPGRLAQLRDWALDELETCAYSRYWHGDMAQADRGFKLLRQAGRQVSRRHRWRAKVMAMLGRIRPEPPQTPPQTPHANAGGGAVRSQETSTMSDSGKNAAAINGRDHLELFLFTTNADLALSAERAGVDGVVVDWERRGKATRQRGFDTQINTDTPCDATTLSQCLRIPIMVRIDRGEGQMEGQVALALEHGASAIMYPMATDCREVERFVNLVAGRARSVVQIETQALVEQCSGLRNIGWDAAYIGLNDLMISRGASWIWQPLVDGTVEQIMETLSGRVVGLGGVTVVGEGDPIRFTWLLREMRRLGSRMSFLRRSFLRDIVGRDMKSEIDAVRAAWRAAGARGPVAVKRDRDQFHRALASLHQSGIAPPPLTRAG